MGLVHLATILVFQCGIPYWFRNKMVARKFRPTERVEAGAQIVQVNDRKMSCWTNNALLKSQQVSAHSENNAHCDLLSTNKTSKTTVLAALWHKNRVSSPPPKCCLSPSHFGNGLLDIHCTDSGKSERVV